ncbi:LacI family DNA-binding transcriptional regulator [Sediminicola luteus]|uniref:LacI family transcriptional regulator n=1 Tax=Sediminicola luteus TaxID=319238 RepID=A0A2A4GFI9_9FLAO|nr:LacI family DNA-binding transcriptional regulator [Sediminicola luteus]PCE66750.1 LacI family transcriptional regulator [Sediminicola luteus]
MKKRVTLKQIAKELDISVSTASKALRDSKEISQDTRDKVKAFAKLYNYKPNTIAISLQNRRTKNIAVVVPEIVHHFFTTLVSGVEKVANAQGYNVVVCLSNESFEQEVNNMEMLANGRIDGFILSLSKGTLRKKDYRHLQEVMDQGMPVTLFDRITDEVMCDKVVIDDALAAKKAVTHLLDRGCKRVALVTTVDYVSVGCERTRGYMNALKNVGIEVDDQLILKIEDMDTCVSEIQEFLSKIEFDGVFGVNELFAVSAIKAAQKKGLRVPKDVAVVGFTDGILSQQFSPSLTTVVQHGYDMGQTAAQMLIDRLESDSDLAFTTQVIQADLVKRESTAVAIKVT